MPLKISDVAGLKPDGTAAGNAYGLEGRVVVIGPEPLLEAWLATNGQRMLTLYGKPLASYAMEWRTNLVAGAWQFGWHVPMTNLFRDFGIVATKPSLFYRAYEFFADPPILELNPPLGSNVVLLLYGRDGTNYILEATTNLSLTDAWLPAANVVMTNSFRFIGAGNPTNERLFFRAVRP